MSPSLPLGKIFFLKGLRYLMLNPQRCGSPSARPSQDWEEGDGDTLAPELLGGAEPSPASDVFSLGASLYELATGARPGPRLARPAPLPSNARQAWRPRPAHCAPMRCPDMVHVTTYACGGASPWCMTLVMRWSAAVPRGTTRVASATCVNQAAETGDARRRLPAAARGRRRGRGRARAARPLAGAAVAGAVDAGAAAGRAAARARAARAGAASRRPQPIARSARGCWAPHARRNAL